MAENKENVKQPTSWLACYGKTELSKRYGSVQEIMMRYNPDAQVTLTKDARGCVMGDYPTLAQLGTYGDNVAVVWLIPQLTNLSEFCGAKEKLSGRVLEECANIIANEFYWLKISEMMLFFARFKSGHYGRFYGVIDPLIIMDALREFLRERNVALDRYERSAEQKRRENKPKEDTLTYEEWEMVKNLAAMYNSEYTQTKTNLNINLKADRK